VESTTIIIAIFAVVIIVMTVAFRHRLKAIIKGPGGTGLEVDASNPSPRPGVYVEDARSRRGGLTAQDDTGRGADARKIEVEKDIWISSATPQDHSRPKVPPPA
jgi:hypothetical protein